MGIFRRFWGKISLTLVLVWAGMIGLLVFSIVAAVQSGINAYGTLFSILFYVFELMTSVVTLPLFVQQLIRLSEISSRLNQNGESA